jgi:hypothetical protein
MVRKMKRQGTEEFKIIDAFSGIKENKFIIECNYCENIAENEEQALQHYDDCHKDIRDKSYPKPYLDKHSGKQWFVPKFETIEHNKYMLNDIDFYIKFYGSCSYQEVSLTKVELKNVHQNPATGLYFYKEDPVWEIESQTKNKPKDKQPSIPSSELDAILKRLDSLEERINRMASQPKSVFSPKKKYRIYSLNVGESKIEQSKLTIKSRYNIPDDFIIVKKNKFGNYSIFYKTQE